MPVRIPHRFAYFNPVTRNWIPIQRLGMHKQMTAKPVSSSFDIVSWNIDFASSQPKRRCLRIIDHVFESGDHVPDILCLQEVTPEVRTTLLCKPELRDAFLVTFPDTGVEDEAYNTMTLLCKRRFAHVVNSGETIGEDEDKFIVGPVFREQLPTRTGRNGLYVDLIPPYAVDTFFRIINVHLESCDAFPYRAQQLKQLAELLHEPGCSGGLIIGDFNSNTNEDHQLIEENGLQDAWLILHGDTNADAPTWNVGSSRDSRYKPSRMDKLVVAGLTVTSMDIMHPGTIDVPKPGGTSDMLEWSDHSGLRGEFSL